jgi:hypothetical protein
MLVNQGTHVHEGRSSSLEGRVEREIRSHSGNGTSTERPEIGGVSVLPVVPDLVDHLGEKVSQKINLVAFIPLLRGAS